MNCELFNNDCFDILPVFVEKGKKFECIISDVPYNIQYLGQDWDKDFDIIKAIQLCELLLTDNGNLILFQGWSNVAKVVNYIQEDSDLTLQNWIIYDRIKGRGGKRNFTSTREDILWLTKTDKYTFNKIYSNIPKKTKGMGEKNGQANRSLTNVWYDISPIVPWSKERNGHPTQKPKQLMERLITIFSNENDNVLDFCMGSGTTGVSAIKLNRNFVGIEKDRQWFNVAKERIENVKEEWTQE